MFQLSGLQFVDKPSLTARHRTAVNTTGSVFENEATTPAYTSFTLDNCTMLPINKTLLQALPEGLREKQVYELYTSTPITGAIEGTENLGDQVSYDAGLGADWYTLTGVQFFNTSMLKHYYAFAVRDSTN